MQEIVSVRRSEKAGLSKDQDAGCALKHSIILIQPTNRSSRPLFLDRTENM